MIHDPGISAACDPDTRRTASTRTRFVRGCKPGGRRGPGLWQQPEPPPCHKDEGPRCRNARFEHTLSASTPPNHDIVILGTATWRGNLEYRSEVEGRLRVISTRATCINLRARGPVAPKLAARLNCGSSSPSCSRVTTFKFVPERLEGLRLVRREGRAPSEITIEHGASECHCPSFEAEAA